METRIYRIAFSLVSKSLYHIDTPPLTTCLNRFHRISTGHRNRVYGNISRLCAVPIKVTDPRMISDNPDEGPGIHSEREPEQRRT